MESFGKTKSNNYPSDKSNRVRKVNAGNGNNMVGMFRFADEAQMGGLSSLMTCGDVKPKLADNNSIDGEDFDYHGECAYKVTLKICFIGIHLGTM